MFLISDPTSDNVGSHANAPLGNPRGGNSEEDDLQTPFATPPPPRSYIRPPKRLKTRRAGLLIGLFAVLIALASITLSNNSVVAQNSVSVRIGPFSSNSVSNGYEGETYRRVELGGGADTLCVSGTATLGADYQLGAVHIGHFLTRACLHC